MFILNNCNKTLAEMSDEDMAIERAESEYEIYKVKQDKEYASSMDTLYKKYLIGEENK